MIQIQPSRSISNPLVNRKAGQGVRAIALMIFMRHLLKITLGLTLAFAYSISWAAPQDFSPASDSVVVERLSPRVKPTVNTPEAAYEAAKQQVNLARQTADPRYLGRAQTTLAAWWNKPDAPPKLAILQATIEQSRHEFSSARMTLQTALQRDPSQAQGWLTLATLERIAANYIAADAACLKVASSGAALYATACQMETASLQGKFAEARAGFNNLQRQTNDASTKAWLMSLLAESEERAGQDAAALKAYQTSLAMADDGYTALALADHLLRTAQAEAALKVLAQQVPSDSVMVRRAYAYKKIGDAGWKTLWAELRTRFSALDARGDDPRLHARELALAALWLEDNPAKAWVAAQLNLEIQKEPIDWWLALHSADAAARKDDVAAIRKQLQSSGLRDLRLARWLTDAKL